MGLKDIDAIIFFFLKPMPLFKMAFSQPMDLDGIFNFQLPIQSLLAILASNCFFYLTKDLNLIS